MKPKGLMFGVVTVLVVTALTAGVATAQSQDRTQQIQSGNATMQLVKTGAT